MRRNGLTAQQTGIAAYSVAHDVAATHLRLGRTVIADAVNPVAEARAGWQDLVASADAGHVVVETICSDGAEHRRRVETRISDLPGWVYPTWAEVGRMMSGYQPRTDERLVLDTTRTVDVSYQELTAHLVRPAAPG